MTVESSGDWNGIWIYYMNDFFNLSPSGSDNDPSDHSDNENDNQSRGSANNHPTNIHPTKEQATNGKRACKSSMKKINKQQCYVCRTYGHHANHCNGIRIFKILQL